MKFGLKEGILLAGWLTLTSCATAYERSLGGNRDAVYDRIFMAEFDTAWHAINDALKTTPLDVKNREAGWIQTKWIDNTAEKNFAENFGSTASFLKAQYRIRVGASKGFYNGKPSVKVSIQKEQLVQYDALEGWVPIEPDGIDENTLLYRIGRVIVIQSKLAQWENERRERALRDK